MSDSNGDQNVLVLDLSEDFLPVETILKEDEGNLLISRKNKICYLTQPNVKKSTLTVAKVSNQQRETQNVRMRVKRQNIAYKQWENEWNRNKMRALRSDPDFKEKEKLKQRERMQIKRLNPQYREIERHKQDMRRRRKKIDIELQAALQLDFQSSPISPLEATSNQLDFISRDVNLWVASQLPIKNGEKEFGFFIHSESSSPPVLDNVIEVASNSKLPQIPKISIKSPVVKPETTPNQDLPAKVLIVEVAKKFNSQLKGNHSSGLQSNQHFKQGKNSNFPFPKTESQIQTLEFRCEICDKSYRSKPNLSRHVKSHYTKFTCSTCDKEFHLKQHLNAHMKTHGERKFSCDKCQYKTCYKYALNRHNDTKHKYFRNK